MCDMSFGSRRAVLPVLASVLAAVAALGLAVMGGRDGHGPEVAVVAPAAFDGAFVLPSSIEEQAGRADLIVVGRVDRAASRRVVGGIVTDVSFSVEQYLKGAAGPSLTLMVPGGQVGSDRLLVGGVPNFAEGERVLLFLQ